MSVHSPAEGHQFVSCVKALTMDGPESALFHYLQSGLVHVVWGMSKDFGLSGFRVGVLYSPANEDLHNVLGKTGYFCGCSNDTQHALTHLLDDDQFVESFKTENHARLSSAWAKLKVALDGLGVSYVEPRGGLFVWVNLKKIAEAIFPSVEMANEIEGEDGLGLWRSILNLAHVNSTPGTSCHSADPFWFRVVFSTANEATVLEAISRLQRLKDRAISESAPEKGGGIFGPPV
jgi:aspartate/methionine/tyrosine aminotransferase